MNIDLQKYQTNSNQNDELVSNPLVSVRILAYNHGKYIAQCLDGVLMQRTNFPFEIIIGEDLSQDETLAICREYKKKYPKLINLIENEKNLGVYENGQKTIAAYRGKYVAWCDGDDFWTDPEKLQKQTDTLESRPDIAICFHNVMIINEITGDSPRSSNVNQKQISTIYDLAKGNFIYSASAVFRRNLFGKYPEFVRNMPAGDYIVHMLNASRGDIFYIDEPMACYRIHTAGAWESQSQGVRHEKWLKVQEALLGLFNPQIDSLLRQAQANIYLILSKEAAKNNNLLGAKELLTRGAEALLEETSQPEAMALIHLLLKEMQPLLDKTRDFRQIYFLGFVSMKKGMLADAVMYLNDAIRINPQYLQSYSVLAEAYQKLGEPLKAIDSLKVYLSKNPNDAKEIIHFCKLLLSNSGNDENAIKILLRLKSKINNINNINNNNNNFEFDINKLLGLEYFNLNNFSESLRYLEKAKEIVGYDIEVLSLLSNIKAGGIDYSLAKSGKEEGTQNFMSKSLNEINQTSITQINSPEKPRTKLPLVSIVIPVFNRLDFTRECIKSIYEKGSRYPFEIIVIDNASSDGTLEYLKEMASSNINFRFLRNNTNLGFAKACNLGIRSAEGDYILLLNNDIIVLENWLDALVLAAENDENTAIVGSLLFYPDGETIQHCGVKIADLHGTLMPFHINKLRNIKYVPSALVSQFTNVVTGASMLIKAKHLPTLGVLDEKFINSYEDVDFCLRARELGLGVYFEAQSQLIHFESLSQNRHDYDEQNLALFNKKWKSSNFIDKGDEVVHALYESWFREELAKDPDNSDYLTKLIEILRLSNESEEMNLLEAKLGEILKNHHERKTNELNQTISASEEALEVSYIILVRDNLEYTQICLDSIAQTSQDFSYEIIIVDNDSSTETSRYLKHFSDSNSNTKLITNTENKSFATANNQAAKFARGKYILFLNNDIKLLPRATREIIDQFERDSATSIQGAKLLYPDDTIQHAGVVWGPVFPELDFHYHLYLAMPEGADCVNLSREYQFVTGAFLAVRAELFERVNGFDEYYFFGHEDLDLCLKIREIGGKVWYNHAARAYHYESVTKKSEGLEKFEAFWSNPSSHDARNHKYFLSKWEGKILRDADEYILNDGMLAYLSDPDIRNNFMDRYDKLVEVIKLMNENHEYGKLSRILKVLFGGKALLDNTFQLDCRLVSEEKLQIAEMMTNDYSDDAFDLSDIFDVQEKQDAYANPENVIENQKYINEEIEYQEKIIFDENIQKENIEEIKISSITAQTHEPQRILMTMYGWNESGGGTTFPHAVALRLARLGHKVAVLYATAHHPEIKEPYYLEHTIEDGVELYGVYNRPTVFLDADNPDREICDVTIALYFVQIIDSFAPDVIHFNNFLGLSFELAKIASERGIVSVYTPYNYHLIDPQLYLYNSDLSLWHGTDFFANSELAKKHPELKENYANRIHVAKKVLNDYVDYTFAVSNRVKEILVDAGGNPDKITVVHQVHETIEQLLKLNLNKSEPINPLKFVFIGGAMPHKGPHIIVQAAQLLPRGSCEFYVYGFIADNYSKLLKTLDRNSAVRLMGKYSAADLPKIASNMDAAILPSLWEDCAPFVITESLAMGLPVIGTNIGGFPDFIKDDFNGKLFGYNSPTELAAIIESLISNPDIIKKWQKNSKITFTFDDHVSHLTNVFSRLISGEKPTIEEMKLLF